VLLLPGALPVLQDFFAAILSTTSVWVAGSQR
jgi:hypothetical protein